MRVRNGLNRDLVKFANGALTLSTDLQKSLLHEAAEAIRCYRALIALSGTPANDQQTNIAYQLDNYGDGLDFRYEEETKAMMLEAADALRILRLMMGIKQEIFEDDNE
jgi:hypothetical protein